MKNSNHNVVYKLIKATQVAFLSLIFRPFAAICRIHSEVRRKTLTLVKKTVENSRLYNNVKLHRNQCDKAKFECESLE